MSCWFRKCSSCMPRGGLAAILGADCERCLADDQAAYSAWGACLVEPECAGWHSCLLERCRSWELDPGCRSACWKEHSEGNDAFFAFGRTVGGCTGSCRWGEHWSCLGRTLDWPNADSDATAHVTLKGGPPDVAVQACPTLNLTVNECITNRFDATGVVTFDLPESPRERLWVYRVPAPTEPQLPTALYVYATPTIGAQYRTLLRAPDSQTSGVPHDPTLGTV